MNEPKVEQLPDVDKLIDGIMNNEPWNPVYRRALEELLKLPAIRAALREVLVQSDDKLKNIGMADLTDEKAIKSCLREQGVAAGLAQAVETICALAATAENEDVQQENKV